VAYQICQQCAGLGSDRVNNCLWDACMMDDADAANGEALGCSTEILMRTAPEERAANCPAGSDWDEVLQSCLGDYEVNRGMTCVGTPSSTQSKYLRECHELCQSQPACAAYTFDVFKNECSLWESCTSVIASTAQMTAYQKDTSGGILNARSGSFDGGSMGGASGPQATYGSGGSTGTSNTVPDFSSVHSNIDDVHENVNEVHDNIDDMRLLLQQLGGSSNTLEQDVDEVHDALQELRTLLATLNTNSGGQQPGNYQPQYNPQYNPQQPGYNPYGQGTYNPYGQPAEPQNNSNDDWKTVGIVSAVLTFVILIGGVIGVSVYFCCMKKN